MTTSPNGQPSPQIEKTPKNGYPSNWKVLCYSIGLGGQGANSYYLGNWLRYFCINLLKIPERKVGSVFALSYVWDAINDPLIGAYIDKRNHKPYNKLRPFTLYLPPIIGVLSAMMFINPGFSETQVTGKLVYIIVLYFLWDFLFSFQDVSMWGMIALSSPHAEERSRVAQWVSIGSGAGIGAASFFQFFRSLMSGGENPPMSDYSVFVTFGLLLGLGGELLSTTAHRMPELVKSTPSKESILKSLGMLKYNKTLWIMSLARVLNALSPRVQNAYFFENCVSVINGQRAEFTFNLFSGIPAMFTQFFATKLFKRLGGAKRMLIFTQIISIIARIGIYFIKFNTLPGFILMTIMFSLVNIPQNMVEIAHRSLLSDSIDEVEYITGQRCEGVCFSFQNFTSKISSGIVSYLEGYLLSKLGYNSSARDMGVKQSDRFLKWQWPMFTLGPIVGSLLYTLTMSFINDNKEHKQEIELELKARREAMVHE